MQVIVQRLAPIVSLRIAKVRESFESLWMEGELELGVLSRDRDISMLYDREERRWGEGGKKEAGK